MKKYELSKQRRMVNEKVSLWDAFINHMDNVYFPGATESLDEKLIAFEYESFKNCFQ